MTQNDSQSNLKDFSNISLTNIVQQLEELVRLTLECEKKELASNVSFADVNKQLTELKKVIDLLHKSYVDTLNSLSLTEDDVEKFRKNIQTLQGPERKLFDTIGRLQSSCEEVRSRLYQSLQGSKQEVKALKAEGDEKKKKKLRKDKFKAIGGKKNWMPT